MKKYFLLIFMLIAAAANADERSDALLAKIRTKISSTPACSFIFSSNEYSGILTVSGNRYRLLSPDMEVYYDGQTLWSYNIPAKEVNVESLPASKTTVLNNPSKLIAASNADFTHKMMNDNTIELIPRNAEVPYSKVVITMNLSSLIPEKAVITDRQSGKSTIITLSNYKSDIKTDTATFRFDTQKNRGVDIVDFR